VKGLSDVCRQPSARNPDLIHATQSPAPTPSVDQFSTGVDTLTEPLTKLVKIDEIQFSFVPASS
jgi:hypothetical protein